MSGKGDEPMLSQLADYTYNYTTTTTSGHAGFLAVIASLWIVILVVAVVTIVGMWKAFVKAGKPGWGAIVPVYNGWLLAEIAGKPGWWGLLVFVGVVPFVGWIAATIISIIIALGVAKNFGKSSAFGVVGLWLFSPVGYCILGFGDSRYQGPSGVPDAPLPQSGAPVTPEAPTPPSADNSASSMTVAPSSQVAASDNSVTGSVPVAPASSPATPADTAAPERDNQ